jgi:hypothetical protein
VSVLGIPQLSVLAVDVTTQVNPCFTGEKCLTHEPLHAQNDETNGNTEFLQVCSVIAADALLEINGHNFICFVTR